VTAVLATSPEKCEARIADMRTDHGPPSLGEIAERLA
jgi:hypothetical protein